MLMMRRRRRHRMGGCGLFCLIKQAWRLHNWKVDTKKERKIEYHPPILIYTFNTDDEKLKDDIKKKKKRNSVMYVI